MCLFDENAPIYFAGDDSEASALIEVGVFARGRGAGERMGRRSPPP